MKIVQTVHGFPPEGVGGTECHVRRLTGELKNRGHRLFVYAGSIEWRDAFTPETATEQGVELTRIHRNDWYFDQWDKAYHPLVERHFLDYLEARKPDLIHVHHWIRLTSNLCNLAARAGYPVVATLHDHYATCPRLFRMKKDGSLCDAPCSPGGCLDCVERMLFQGDLEIRYALAAYMADARREAACATRLLVPSRSHGEAVTRHFGLEEHRVEVLPLAPPAELEPAPRPPLGGKLRMVYFSHLYPHKGPGLLIEAFRKMKHRDRAELHLFGKEVLPDFFEKLQELAAGLDVTFHGAYRPKDLEAFPMDLAVIPSLVAESYSFILDEAHGLQVPMLAPDAGAIPERAGGSVMLYRRGDPDDLARAMDRVASERSLLDAMRAAPPIRVMAMEEHLDRLERIYGEAVKQGPPAVEDGHFHRRLEEQWDRREFNFRELRRSEHWEALSASLRQRIEELERELSERNTPS